MIPVTKDEAEKLRQRFPTLHIHRTIHKWYCAEHQRALRYLDRIRHEKGVKS